MSYQPDRYADPVLEEMERTFGKDAYLQSQTLERGVALLSRRRSPSFYTSQFSELRRTPCLND